MKRLDEVRAELVRDPRAWLVTGCAGFIGSNLVVELLRLGQRVTGLDDFSTGDRANLVDVESRVGADAWSRFRLVEGDVCDVAACRSACEGGPLVSHQAALGSVPRSLADPAASFRVNVSGFATLLEAARSAGSPRVVYASSSSVYGDDPELPKVEARLGAPLSPYAATKAIGELWAHAIARGGGPATIGLRYFNVFGPRQDPEGPYAAVIPRWIHALLRGVRPVVHGDGQTSRDFCPVANAVQANLLAALAPDDAAGRAFNVALGRRIALSSLFESLRDALALRGVQCAGIAPVHAGFRPGDVRHSQADLTASREVLGYEPEVDFEHGLELAVEWYLRARPTPASS